MRAHFKLEKAPADVIGEGAQRFVFELELFHCLGAWLGPSSEDRTRGLRRLARIYEFVFELIVFVGGGSTVIGIEVAVAVGMANRFLLCACEDVGVGDGASGGGDDVKAFGAIEGTSCGGTAMLVAKSAKGRFREDLREVGICCKRSVFFGGFAGQGYRTESGGCRWGVIEVEREAGEGEGGGEFGKEGFKGRVEALEGFVGSGGCCGFGLFRVGERGRDCSSW